MPNLRYYACDSFVLSTIKLKTKQTKELSNDDSNEKKICLLLIAERGCNANSLKERSQTMEQYLIAIAIVCNSTVSLFSVLFSSNMHCALSESFGMFFVCSFCDAITSLLLSLLTSISARMARRRRAFIDPMIVATSNCINNKSTILQSIQSLRMGNHKCLCRCKWFLWRVCLWITFFACTP